MTKLDAFTEAYITCMLWSETDQSDDSGGEPLDSNYDASDLSPDALERIEADCAKFQADNWDMISDDLGQAGHDFWLTRVGHGAGFWDGDWPEHGDALTEACKRFGHVDVYVGDDNLLYLT